METTKHTWVKPQSIKLLIVVISRCPITKLLTVLVTSRCHGVLTKTFLLYHDAPALNCWMLLYHDAQTLIADCSYITVSRQYHGVATLSYWLFLLYHDASALYCWLFLLYHGVPTLNCWLLIVDCYLSWYQSEVRAASRENKLSIEANDVHSQYAVRARWQYISPLASVSSRSTKSHAHNWLQRIRDHSILLFSKQFLRSAKLRTGG